MGKATDWARAYWSNRGLVFVASSLTSLALACADQSAGTDQHAIESEVLEGASVDAETVPEMENVVYPAPISLPAVERAEPSLAPSDLRTRLHLIPAGELMVVDGVIAALEPRERQFTGEHAETTVGTEVTLRVNEVLCGSLQGELFQFTYLAGTVGAKSYYSSLMPSDLRIGDRYVFVVRKVVHEYLLEMGRADLHRVVSADEVEVYGTGVVPRIVVEESCP